MPDVIEKLGRSLIQHGTDSDRVYLMKLDPGDVPSIVERLERLAKACDYGKIFCKVPVHAVEPFTRAGYVEEARIPGFFHAQVDAAFMSRFRRPHRAQRASAEQEAIAEILALARAKQGNAALRAPADYTVGRLEEGDAARLAALYRRIFPSYPFPIFDPDYLRRTMTDHIRYYGAFQGGQLAAASSAETDVDARNVEMTDFATSPDHRGHGLAAALLGVMEADMKAAGFATAYTIARAVSAGINVTFARCGYHFAGTLVNNTQISGRIESMNVWYKDLLRASET